MRQSALLLWIFPSLIALTALFRLPYHLYFVIRTLICLGSIILTLLELRISHRNWYWIFALVFIAITINPIFPIGLHRARWAIIDLAIAATLLIHLYFRKKVIIGAK